MSDPLVTVVIAAYDRPSMLHEALASVLSQSWSNLEVLVGDDSPHDACAGVVAEFDDSRIRYWRNTPALGTRANHLLGYREARGDYIATLNDDDLYTADYLAEMVAALERHPQASLAFANHSVIDQDGVIDDEATLAATSAFGRSRLAEGLLHDVRRPALVDRSVPGMFAVIRRSALDLDDFPVEVSSGYDFWLVYLAVRDGNPAFFDPRNLTSYRVHAGSQTSSFSADVAQRRRSEDYTQFIDRRLIADPRLRELRPALRRRLARSLVSSGTTSLQQDDRAQATRHFAASLTTRPTLHATAGLVACAAGRRGARALLERVR